MKHFNLFSVFGTMHQNEFPYMKDQLNVNYPNKEYGGFFKAVSHFLHYVFYETVHKRKTCQSRVLQFQSLPTEVDKVPTLPSSVRDVSSVELLQKYHQGIRSEIEARGAKFTDCVDLGKALLTRKHRDSAEVRPRQQRQLVFILLLSSDLIAFLGVIIPVWHNGPNWIGTKEK